MERNRGYCSKHKCRARRSPALALFNLAIDSKLRGCDVVSLKVEDIAPHGYTMERAAVRQKKTGRPVRFELTEQTRQAVDEYLRLPKRQPGSFLFGGRRGRERSLTTRQYARLVSTWVAMVGLDAGLFGTHSLRRTKATLIYRKTGNQRSSFYLAIRRLKALCDTLGSRWTTRSRSRSR
jgi:integrase